MKIIGGRGSGADNEKTRIIEIEPGDVYKRFEVSATWETVDDGVDLMITYSPSGRMTMLLDDPVEKAEPPAPFWVKPQAAEKVQDYVPPREPTRLEYDLADVLESGCNGVTALLNKAAMDWALVRWSAIQAQRQFREACHD